MPPFDDDLSQTFGSSDESSSSESVLVHIGYHKTGSTYLQNHVFTRAFGFTANTGENRTGIVRDFVVSDSFAFDPQECGEKYNRYVRQAEQQGYRFVLSHERLSGYPPSGGYDRKLIADRLAACFPSARVLIVIREQAALIRSTYSQYVTDGGHLHLADFMRTAEPALGRLPGFRLHVYEFDKMIHYYQILFGEDRVLVLPFEMLAADRNGFIRRIAAFMNLPVSADYPAAVSNARRPVPMQYVQRWLNRYFSDNELSRGALLHVPKLPRRFARFEPIFKVATPRRLDNWLHDRILTRISESCGDQYVRSNGRTVSITGLNLKDYGYKL